MIEPTVRAELGTVSHGTLRVDDLLWSFCSHLSTMVSLQPPEFHRHPYRELEVRVSELLAVNPVDRDASWCDQADCVLEDLAEALNDFAPDDAHFGVLEGDGTDFGYWMSEED